MGVDRLNVVDVLQDELSVVRVCFTRCAQCQVEERLISLRVLICEPLLHISAALARERVLVLEEQRHHQGAASRAQH